MGQAKNKKAEQNRVDQIAMQIDFARVATAVQKLSHAASQHTGSDCVLQASIASSVLSRLGVPATVRVGFAAWRVGEGDGDVISHIPMKGKQIGRPDELPFHAWLQVGTQIFDITTNQLPLKARLLDQDDGKQTTVGWAPPFLLLPQSNLSTYMEVAQGGTGLVYYEQNEAMERHVMRTWSKSIEDEDHAWLIYQNPSVEVIGPNQAG